MADSDSDHGRSKQIVMRLKKQIRYTVKYGTKKGRTTKRENKTPGCKRSFQRFFVFRLLHKNTNYEIWVSHTLNGLRVSLLNDRYHLQVFKMMKATVPHTRFTATCVTKSTCDKITIERTINTTKRNRSWRTVLLGAGMATIQVKTKVLTDRACKREQ